MVDDTALKQERVTVTLNGKDWIIEEPKRRQLRIILADIHDIQQRYQHIFDADGTPRDDAPPRDMVRCLDAMIDVVLRATGAPESVGDTLTEIEIGEAYSIIVNFTLGLSRREGLLKGPDAAIPEPKPACFGE